MAAVEDAHKFIVEYAKRNPVGAGLILGGMAVLSSAAAFLASGAALTEAGPVCLWMIGIGFLLAVLAYIATHPVLMPLVASCLILFAAVYGLLFVLHTAFPTNTVFGCLVSFDCREGADRSAAQDPESNAAIAVPPSTLPSQDTDVTSSNGDIAGEPTAVAGDYPQRVFVQFAGAITRDAMRAFMRDMASAGWNVQGVEDGGERIATAAGLSEVRYGPPEDEQAAQALVDYLNEHQVIGKTFKAKQLDIIQKGVLELWMGR